MGSLFPIDRSLVLLVGSLILTCLSLYASLAELRPFEVSAQSAADRFSALEDRAMPSALSIEGNRAVMLACLNAMQGLYAMAQPTDRRTRVAKSCERSSEAVLAREPSSGLAWLVGAASAAISGNWADFAARLSRSRAITPSEQWLAEARLQLVRQMSAAAHVEEEGQMQDVRLLAETSSGRAVLAKRYLDDKEFRDLLVRAVDMLDNATKRKILDAIRLKTS